MNKHFLKTYILLIIVMTIISWISYKGMIIANLCWLTAYILTGSDKNDKN